MIVDDSAVIRGLLARALEADPEIEIVSTVADGEQALAALKRKSVDVVVLDIEMPVMDGMTALPKMLAQDPTVKVIMASTLTAKNAEISLQALSAGAADYIPKPTSTGALCSATDFNRELVSKVKALGFARRGKRPGTRAGAGAVKPAPKANAPIMLRSPSTARPRALAIGSSTGGPQALFELFSNLDKGLDVPILVTQHMPPTFTAILAQTIGRQSGYPTSEAEDGEAVARGHVYVAPGGFHMLVAGTDADRRIRLTQDAPENFCRPAVDPMLRSLAEAYHDVLAVILTGMGTDGVNGGRGIIDAGGAVIAQDEASSVVWGMPGAVAAAGLCSAVLSMERIAPYVNRIMTGSHT